MCPSVAAARLLDGCNGHSVASSKVSNRQIGSTDFANGILCQSRTSVSAPSRHATVNGSVFLVAFCGHVFQVLRPVVALVAIAMVNLMSTWTRTNERCCNKLMDMSRLGFAVSPEIANQVTITLRPQLNIASRKPSGASEVARDLNDGRLSPQPTKRAYRVQPFVTCDRAPLFKSHGSTSIPQCAVA